LGAPGTTIAEYQYDGRTYRTCKLVANGGNWDRTDFYYNTSWQILEERTLLTANKTTVATLPKHQYVWDVRYIDALILRDDNKDPSPNTSCTDLRDERLYYCQDANYNVTALVNSSGDVVERVQYEPYGKHTLYTATWATQVATVYSNQILFASYNLDAEISLYQVRYRQYHGSLGRWLQRDPIKYASSRNLGAMSSFDALASTSSSAYRCLVSRRS
jgi:RHS repeat-associated protein